MGKGLPTIDEHSMELDEETLQGTFGRRGGLKQQLDLQSPINVDGAQPRETPTSAVSASVNAPV